MSRHWDATDRERDDDEAEYWRDRQAEQEAAYDAASYGEFLRAERRFRRGVESPRRQALFRKAEATMRVMVALRGVYGPPLTITAWYGGHGRRLGLFGYYDNDHELQWEPRRGFRVIEIEDIPF